MSQDGKALVKRAELSLEDQAALVKQYYDVAFTHTIDRDEAAQKFTQMIASAAEKQIRAETTPESPWSVEATDSADEAHRKAMVFERAVVSRALAISEARRLADEQAQFYLVKHFKERQLEQFPEDGTFEELGDIVSGIISPRRSGPVLQVLKFFETAGKAVEESAVTMKQVIELVNKRGPYALGKIQTAANQELGDDATKEEIAAKYEELFEDADQKSRSEWQQAHGGKKSIPPMDYTERKGSDGTSLFVIVANTSRQRSLLLSRLSGAIKVDKNLSAEGPVTAQKLYLAMVQAAQAKQPELATYLRELMNSAVLQNGPCYDVYTVLSHAEGYMTLEEFDVIPDLSRATIMDALARLNHYGLVLEITHKEKPGDKGIRMWGLFPRGGDGEHSESQENHQKGA